MNIFPFWLECIISFIAAFLSNWCFALYIRRSAGGSSHRAAMWSTLVVIFSGINIVGYTTNFLLLIPIAVGYYIGTYTSVWYDHKKQHTHSS